MIFGMLTLFAFAAPLQEPAIIPAQFTASAVPAAAPAPNVQLVLVVPQDSPPNANLNYQLRVTNSSSATAHKVRVRMPVPTGGEFVSAEPKGTLNGKEWEWSFNSLGANASETIRVVVRPSANAAEVVARGFVSFEHGQQVQTRLNAPKLKLRMESPKTAALGDAVPVRLLVSNEGRVPVLNVRVTANITSGFEIDRASSGEATKEANQRVWDVGTLPPGGAKRLDLKVNAKVAGELLATAFANGKDQGDVKDETKTLVREARLKVDFRGDPNAEAGGTAAYFLTVSNTGTMPLNNLRVNVALPEGCRVTSKTEGGKVGRGQLTWTLPSLANNDAFEFRFKLSSETAGRKLVRVAIAADRADAVEKVETIFAGTPSLRWDSSFDQALLTRDNSGMFTVAVKNSGTDTAKNVKLAVTLPKEVKLVKATPTAKEENGVLTFEPREIAIGGSERFSVQFRAEAVGTATFDASLADGTNAKPLTATKSVEIVLPR